MQCRLTYRSQMQQRGAVLVEAAILLPVALVAICGAIEFGRAVQVGRLANRAAQHGVELAILPGASSSGVTSAIKEFLACSRQGIPASAVTVEIDVIPGPTIQNANCQNLCQVTVTIPCHRMTGISSRILRETTVRGVCAMHCP